MRCAFLWTDFIVRYRLLQSACGRFSGAEVHRKHRKAAESYERSERPAETPEKSKAEIEKADFTMTAEEYAGEFMGKVSRAKI